MGAFEWALLTALVWGMVPAIEKFALIKIDPFIGLFFRCFGVIIGFILLSFFLVTPEKIKGTDPKTIALLVFGGFIGSFVGQIAFYHGLKVGEVSKVAPIAGSFPLIAAILGIVFLGESITIAKSVGIFLIISGIFFLR